jgi:glutaredoxin
MKFVIYSKDGCPYCDQIKKVMHLAGLEHVVYNLGEHYSKDDFYYEFGEGTTFPQVLMGNRKLGGCKDTILFLKEQKIL